MKQITNKTVILQVDKTFQPIEVDGVVYWIDNRPPMFNEYWCYLAENEDIVFTKNSLPLTWFEKLHDLKNYYTVVAQSKPILNGITVIDLQAHIAQKLASDNGWDWYNTESSARRVFELWAKQISNSIQSIEVDNDFNIISFS